MAGPRPLCADVDPEVFHGTATTLWAPGRRFPHLAYARVVCAACPMRVECLADAIEREDGYAIRAGKTPAQRLPAVRAQRRARQDQERAA